MTNKSTLAQGLSHAWPWTKPIGSSPTTSRLLRYSLLCMLILLCGGSAWAEDATLAVDFEKETTSYTDWTFTNFATKQTNSGVAAHGGSYFGSTNSKTSGSLVTKEKLAKPKNIQFYISKTSTNNTTSSWIIKVSTDGETWTNVKTQSASADITKGTWTEVTQDLTSYTNVYVGIFYDGTTAIRTIDDVTLTYENVNDTRTATTLAFAEGYATTGTEGGTIDLPTATVMAGETAVTGAEVTWKSSDESVAKIEGNKISLLTPGTATITASYDGDDTYKKSSATYQLTVTEVSIEGLSSMVIVFKDSGNDSDGTSAVSSIDAIISEGTDYVSTIDAAKVYNGRTGRGLKLGASSNPGTLTLTLAQAVKPIKITFDAMQYSDTETSITVNGKTITNLGSELATYSVIYDGETEVSSIEISTPSKRAYITNVKIYYEPEATPDPLYILGVEDLNEDNNTWSLPADMKEMTWNAENEAYEYTLNNTSTAYFCFSQTNEITENDWETFNSTYRWAYSEGGFTPEINTETQLNKVTGGNDNIELPAGQWTISVTQDMIMTITGEATPVTPTEAKYYVVGNMTDWKVDESYEMTRNEGADIDEYSFTMDLTTESQFKVVKVEEGKENVWYPEGMDNNYGEITADGTYTIYFRPNYDGGDGWFYNCIYVAEEEPEPFVFRDIKLDLTVQGFLTDDEYNNKSAVTAKLLVDEEGNISRNDEATEPNATVTGNTRKDNHGWDNFTMTAPVTGKVKITIGGCEFNSSSKVLTVTPEGGEAFTIAAPAACWHSAKTKNIKSGYFDAGEQTVTLTITGPEYTPYVAIEAVDEIPSIYTVTYAKESDVEGTIPAEVEVTIGEAITLPKNYTLYKEGYTQTGWTDGTTTYELGGSFTPEDDVTLTAVFTENTVNLADRTEAVTITFPLNGNKTNGLPLYNINNSGIIVTQATVGNATIDVKASITSGTLATNESGYHQVKNNFKATIPSCKGATVVINTYDDPTSLLTFGESTVFEVSGSNHAWTATYTATADATSLDIAQSGSTYWNKLEITLPKVESTEPGGETLEDIEAIWSWKDGQPATITSVNIENSANPVSVASTVEDINMTVIATSGKLKANGDNAQYNAGTKLQIPVVSKQDVVTVVCHAYNFQDIKVGGTTYTTQTVEYTATAADVTAGFVEIEAIHDMYLYSVKVKQVPSAAPTTLDNKEATVTWALNAGNITDAPTYAEGTAEYFVNAYIALGDNFTQASGYPKSGNSNDSNGTDQTLFNPATATTSSTGEYVEFMIKPKANFKPTNVSFSATKYGTDAPTVKAVWVKTDGTEVSLSSGPVAIARNKKDPNVSTLSYKDELSAIDAARGICGLRIYVTCANNKQVGFNNVQITGTLNGEVVDAETATINVTIDPEGAGEVAISPKGTEQEVGTEITLKQTKNFGYAFDGWYINDEKVGSEDSYTFELNANTDITAKYTAVETYALTVNVEGGNSYQVTASPEATDGKYEAGTEVTLTAVENPVVKFTNWSTSATEKEIKVTINEDTEITANFAATDEIVAAWDFYEALGNSGKQDRAAAFKGENNDGTILTLRNAEGTSVAWLDRNYTNPYNGAICAINWQKNAYGEYYWQTKVNASSYKTMKVYSEMYYNYRAYNKYDVQYSVDGTEWTTLGTFELSKDDWSKLTLDIPEAADNKEEVYVRWIKAEDAVLDETASDNGGNNNDGIGIANIFITGTKELVDDGTAPVLQSQVPAANSENASINGQVVLTFDEKIQLTGGTKATLGEEELEPIVAGKALMFKYQGLDYDTEYTFTLPANFVSDLMNNTLEEEISFTFKTMTRPTVTKAAYDFIVPDDGTFAEAVAAANSRSDKTKRYFIFVKKGEYQLMGTGETENAEDDDHNPYTYTNRITDITASNISIIGEDRDATILYNSPDHEGIGVTATLRITKDVENTYIEDITIKNAWEYTGTTGRAVTIQDKGTRTIAKNVKLLSYQDTYYSNNQSGEFFFEDGEIHGTVDFVCGTGDVIYKDVTLYLEKRTGNVISAPNQPKEFGYVFLDCTIDGDAANEGTYYLGRPWGTGVKAQFVNTQMKVTPAAAGWTEMGAGRYPAVFAEFNSYKEDMSPIDLSGRKTSFGASDTTTAVESSGAELTTEQVASLTVQNIFGDWLPTQYTIQEEAPSNVKIDQNGKLTWDADDYALCYVVCADGDAIAVTTENSFDTATAGAPALRRSGDTVTYTVRAANAMGGLGEESAAASPATGINATLNDSTKDSVIYDLNGRRVMTPTKGVYIINGKKTIIK